MYGIQPFLSILIFIFVFYFLISFVKNRGITHLALSRFSIDPTNEDIIIIEGRKTGLVQWLLVKLNLGNTYKIHIKKDFISYSADSAAGKSLILIPIHKVSSTSCGFRKPIELLVLGGLLLIFAIVMLFINITSFFILLIIGGVFLALYIYMKNFFVMIESVGSMRIGFSFKRSFIENIPIEIDKIEEAIQSINSLVIDNK